MVRGFGEGRKVLELLAERESLFQRLTQTKPDNLSKKFSAYTIDPRTRYPNLVIGVSVVQFYYHNPCSIDCKTC